MKESIRIYAGHPEYDVQTYTAVGRVALADGYSESRVLFRFRGPAYGQVGRDGLLKLAQALSYRGVAGFYTRGAELVERTA